MLHHNFPQLSCSTITSCRSKSLDPRLLSRPYQRVQLTLTLWTSSQTCPRTMRSMATSQSVQGIQGTAGERRSIAIEVRGQDHFQGLQWAGIVGEDQTQGRPLLD